ncbi:AAA family ATPase [Lactobacillus sp. PV012]|uniref:AAA family ATPase n=1 Tax=Lactobacillus sp. PV012 TaxID=2594494 RepID=UPI00223F057B|nr:AAA family ATPase [Lactobacillus sp. PV012]
MTNRETRHIKKIQPKLTFLKVKIENHPLFKDGLEFSLMSGARVTARTKDQLTNLSGKLWVTNLATIVGKNATGKTTILNTIAGILTLLFYDLSIEQTSLKNMLIGNNPIKITTFFYGSNEKLYKDEIVFKNNGADKKWIIDSEKIYQKEFKPQFTKKQILDFTGIKPILDRKELDEVAATILATNDSIFRVIIAKENYKTQTIIENIIFTNVNAIYYGESTVPTEILRFLDPTIDYLKVEQQRDEAGAIKLLYRLKFKNRDEEITATGFDVIQCFLSSGTSKGITLYGNVVSALKSGGIIFVDELENHFNHAIVRSFIEYFSDPKVNVNRATLIFSTHYHELLDNINRGDEIYITKRKEKIELQRYSSTDIRNDYKKSEVFESDLLGGTAPEYESYLRLKKQTKKVVEDKHE